MKSKLGSCIDIEEFEVWLYERVQHMYRATTDPAYAIAQINIHDNLMSQPNTWYIAELKLQFYTWELLWLETHVPGITINENKITCDLFSLLAEVFPSTLRKLNEILSFDDSYLENLYVPRENIIHDVLTKQKCYIDISDVHSNEDSCLLLTCLESICDLYGFENFEIQNNNIILPFDTNQSFLQTLTWSINAQLAFNSALR